MARGQKSDSFADSELRRMVLVFAVLVITLNLAVWQLGRTGSLIHFETFTATIAAWSVSLSGIAVAMSGNVVYLPSVTWLVNTECTALFVMIVYVALILAYPASVRAKLIAVVLGLPAIFVTNIVRLFVLAWLTELDAAYGVFFHDYVWQVAFVLMVVVLWVTWVDRVVRREREDAVCR